MKALKNITLEMSLKPFFSTERIAIQAVCRTVFEQWSPLLRHAGQVSVLLWASDGSEMLEYKGELDEEFEWAKYIGGANPRMNMDSEADPEGRGLHAGYYLYRDEPAIFTYRVLKELISIIKETGREITGKPITVGETFDPGPEFAKSEFKYSRHNEICVGESMGRTSMVCCYGILRADCECYAAFPGGIPDGTPFGTFLGKQAQLFLRDMGFDYLWLSNGFGFGTETWGTTGATFDGETFNPDITEQTQHRILEFWRLFRRECRFPVQTRGTNLTAGIDFATDAVNIKAIYEGGFDILPPPNSPWAAIDGNFGLELAGYMTRMAELPGEDYIFRFYMHDPWWMNSPWFDRYEGQPHDIYLPLATVRIDANGDVKTPTQLNLLTIDNSLGQMPENGVNGVIPHLLNGLAHAPDAPSPFVLVYPFREYQQTARLSKPFFEDWFLTAVINKGLPVNTVISTDHFLALRQSNSDFLKTNILVTPVPAQDSGMNRALIIFVQGGGHVMLYGSTEGADPFLLEFLNLRHDVPLVGDLPVLHTMVTDTAEKGCCCQTACYGNALSDGGAAASVVDEANTAFKAEVWAENNDEKRILLSSVTNEEWNGGAAVWCRGINCARLAGQKPQFPLDRLFCRASITFGYDFLLRKRTAGDREPVLAIHLSGGVCWLSGYVPDTTADLELKTPLGAPLLTGWETWINDKRAVYRMPRAWHCECRVFVTSREGSMLACKELPAVSYTQRHRLVVTGLEDATVYVLSDTAYGDYTELLLNSKDPFLVGEPFAQKESDTIYGRALCAEGISGTLIVSDCARITPCENSGG